jgi:hypothetical protein
MCEYCEHVEFETKVGDPTPRKWFKRFSADTFDAGSWHLFYRHTDDHPWYISHNGTIARIDFCPRRGKDLREIRFFTLNVGGMPTKEVERAIAEAKEKYRQEFGYDVDKDLLRPVRRK